MRFHEFHLEGYSVSKNGTEIILELVWDYAGSPRDTSRIRFSEVAAYHFVHTGGAIITDIESVPLPELIREVGAEMSEWWRFHGGLLHWNDNPANYIEALERHGYHAWQIGSAIGFEGFIIAQSAQQVE